MRLRREYLLLLRKRGSISAEQRIRVLLFFLSVTIFLTGLPIILSFALGYKFDRRTLKFTKTGLIVFRTQPAGANVYLNRQLLDIKTPVTLTELLPGNYNIMLVLDEYYPWINDVRVDANRVTRLEKIILFPLRPDVKQLNRYNFSSFWVDEAKEDIYYIGFEENSIYSSDLHGQHYRRLANFTGLTTKPLGWKVSPDRNKFLYFNTNQIGFSYFVLSADMDKRRPSFIINYPLGKIIDVFWHSDSYHIIIVGENDIEAMEARPHSRPVFLTNRNKKSGAVSYDISTDTLYFIDSQEASDGNTYDNLYKLELNSRNFLSMLDKNNLR